jgi:hypothetical protein
LPIVASSALTEPFLPSARHAHGFQRRFIGSGGNLRQYVGLKGGDIAHANYELRNYSAASRQ